MHKPIEEMPLLVQKIYVVTHGQSTIRHWSRSGVSDPLFLSVKAGMTVTFQQLPEEDNNFIEVMSWMANVDHGTVRWVNAGLVTHIVPSD